MEGAVSQARRLRALPLKSPCLGRECGPSMGRRGIKYCVPFCQYGSCERRRRRRRTSSPAGGLFRRGLIEIFRPGPKLSPTRLEKPGNTIPLGGVAAPPHHPRGVTKENGCLAALEMSVSPAGCWPKAKANRRTRSESLRPAGCFAKQEASESAKQKRFAAGKRATIEMTKSPLAGIIGVKTLSSFDSRAIVPFRSLLIKEAVE